MILSKVRDWTSGISGSIGYPENCVYVNTIYSTCKAVLDCVYIPTPANAVYAVVFIYG